jgi:hypothetical protein
MVWQTVFELDPKDFTDNFFFSILRFYHNFCLFCYRQLSFFENIFYWNLIFPLLLIENSKNILYFPLGGFIRSSDGQLAENFLSYRITKILILRKCPPKFGTKFNQFQR